MILPRIGAAAQCLFLSLLFSLERPLWGPLQLGGGPQGPSGGPLAAAAAPLQPDEAPHPWESSSNRSADCEACQAVSDLLAASSNPTNNHPTAPLLPQQSNTPPLMQLHAI